MIISPYVGHKENHLFDMKNPRKIVVKVNSILDTGYTTRIEHPIAKMLTNPL